RLECGFNARYHAHVRAVLFEDESKHFTGVGIVFHDENPFAAQWQTFNFSIHAHNVHAFSIFSRFIGRLPYKGAVRAPLILKTARKSVWIQYKVESLCTTRFYY